MFISFLRTILLYLIIVVTLRVLGKRQVGELEPSELVVAILISDLAAVPMQDIGIPLLSGVIPILTLLVLELLISELSMRSIRFRGFLCGKPTFLILDGHIDQRAMERNRFTLDELQECLRQNNILDVSQVKYAILETNGQLSTFLYPQYAPLTPKDAGKKAQDEEFPVTVISDGHLMTANLEAAGFDLSWLQNQLFRVGLAQQEVFLLTVTHSGQVHLIPKEANT
jgi:uncharacterized membrane protein YcaP (DUF421 family)